MTARLDAALRELADALREEVRTELSADRPAELLSVEEAARRAGIGRSLMYAQISSGLIRRIRIGRRTLVPADELAKLGAQVV